MADPLYINVSAGAPSYTANELRQGMALALMYGGRNLGARQGVRPGGTQLQVSLAGSVITVQPGVACVDPALSTPQGPYWVAIPAAENPVGGPLAAASASLPRKDIVILRVYDHDEDVSGLRLARSEYIAGVANASPAEPAIPAGSFRLATIDVPASPGAAVVTNNAPFTVSPGGILPVRAAGDIAAAVAGRYRDRLDTGVLERDSGAAWETIADPNVFKAWTTWTPTWTNLTVGNGTVVAKRWLVGKAVSYRLKFTLGSTSAITGVPTFTLPVTPHADYAVDDWFGPADALDAAIASYPFSIRYIGGGVAQVRITATTPFTFAGGDSFSTAFTYEGA